MARDGHQALDRVGNGRIPMKKNATVTLPHAKRSQTCHMGVYLSPWEATQQLPFSAQTL